MHEFSEFPNIEKYKAKAIHQCHTLPLCDFINTGTKERITLCPQVQTDW